MASDADERVEEEDAAPADVLGEHAAERRTDREADRGDAGPDADGLRLRLGIGNAAPDQRERRDVDDRRTDPLEAARRDEHADARREPAADRRDAEDDDAADVRAPAAVVIAERARPT